jgi:hypothetical protein
MFLGATPKPRLLKVQISPQGEDFFSVGGSKRMAMHYVLKVEIGGIAGVIAPLLGKKPPDIDVWILGGEAPAFVKSEGPLYLANSGRVRIPFHRGIEGHVPWDRPGRRFRFQLALRASAVITRPRIMDSWQVGFGTAARRDGVAVKLILGIEVSFLAFCV